jgi:hypothetical protein
MRENQPRRVVSPLQLSAEGIAFGGLHYNNKTTIFY